MRPLLADCGRSARRCASGGGAGPGQCLDAPSSARPSGTGPEAPPFPTPTVIVIGDRIACAGARPGCPVPAGAEIVEARGRFLLPGLIDTHVHLLLPAGGITDTSIRRDLHDLLARGVTAVRDMGNNPPRLLEAVDAAQPAPRVFAMQLVAGHHFFSPETERSARRHRPQLCPRRDGDAAARLVADPVHPSRRRRVGCPTGPGGRGHRTQALSGPRFGAGGGAGAAAHAAGMPIWGHGWVQPASVLQQAQAGQDGVVHAAGLAGELLACHDP